MFHAFSASNFVKYEYVGPRRRIVSWSRLTSLTCSSFFDNLACVSMRDAWYLNAINGSKALLKLLSPFYLNKSNTTT